MGARAGLDDVEKEEFLSLPGLELRPSVVQPVASHYTDCTVSALIIISGSHVYFETLYK
jgi:hypothetical protein